MEYIGFALVLMGMSAVESEGIGLVIAVGMILVGGVMMFVNERRTKRW